jgi:hypothetical protein
MWHIIFLASEGMSLSRQKNWFAKSYPYVGGLAKQLQRGQLKKSQPVGVPAHERHACQENLASGLVVL